MWSTSTVTNFRRITHPSKLKKLRPDAPRRAWLRDQQQQEAPRVAPLASPSAAAAALRRQQLRVEARA
jgi:hypothetical protein